MNEAANLFSIDIDLRVKFSANGQIRNYYVLAIPVQNRNTRENMYTLLSKLFEGFRCNSWKQKLIEISSNGISNMTFCMRAFVSKLERNGFSNCFSVCCEAHPLKLVVQDVSNQIVKDTFKTQLNC